MRSNENGKDSGPFEKIGEGVGGLAGRAAGQATDFAMNALGTVMGAAVNVLGDWWSSEAARSAAGSFGEREERECRSHHERTAGSSGRTYDEARPLYRFGHMAGQSPDYQGRSFKEVEPELRKAWGSEQRSHYGDWPEVRGYVGFGFGDPNVDEPLA